jgi:predicted O-methyltransferase YrrM
MSVALHYLGWSLGLAQAHTQTTAAERACLARHATGRRVIVEIGVFEGVTTRVLRGVMAEDGVLYAVDPFQTGRLGVSLHERIAHHEVSRSPRGRVEWMRTTGRGAAADPRVANAAVDFMFVDGDHSWDGIAGDWQAWKNKVVSGGIVAFHDSRETPGAGSQEFTEQVISHEPGFMIIDTESTVTVVQRQA